MKQLVIYIHGKGGSAAEAAHYKVLFPEAEVVGFDYKSENPWDAAGEFEAFYTENTAGSDRITVIANSIGAFFLLNSLNDTKIDKTYLISPIVDMEQLIKDMLLWNGNTEAELEERKTIETNFGETLSWEYLTWVREHPIRWNHPTSILYGSKDNLQSRETITVFADRIGAELTIMEEGEHWFHTKEQMEFLDRWISGRYAALETKRSPRDRRHVPSLHDCRCNRMEYKDSILTFYFPEGIYILNRENNCELHTSCPEHREPERTGPARMYCHLIDEDFDGFTVYIYRKTRGGKTIREGWTENFIAAVNDGTFEFEFVDTLEGYQRMLYRGYVWFERKPYHMECEIEVHTDRVWYSWE